mgnify:FL=1
MGTSRLKGKVTIVTGSGQGIGQAIARVFAAEGAKVVIATRTQAHGEATLKLIKGDGGEAMLCTVDIGNVEQAVAMVETTVKKYGRLDIMVHNAASFLGGPVESY